MNQIWLILHLLGFGAAVTSSIANGIVMLLLREAPGDAPVLGKLPPRLARVGQGGLGLLWITGLIMVWSVFGGPQNLPGLFWWKFACVVAITVLVAMMGMIVKQMQAGDRSGMARLPMFGGATAILLLLVVIFAVYAFD